MSESRQVPTPQEEELASRWEWRVFRWGCVALLAIVMTRLIVTELAALKQLILGVTH
jgi:hypothetical protein